MYIKSEYNGGGLGACDYMIREMFIVLLREKIWQNKVEFKLFLEDLVALIKAVGFVNQKSPFTLSWCTW